MRMLRILALGSLILAQPAANAATLFSTLGNAGSLYNCCLGPFPGIGGGPPPVGPYTKGYAFAPSLGGVMEQIDLPFWGYPPAVVAITLNADDHGSPGAVLDSWNLSPSGVDWSTCCALDVLIAHGPVPLSAGAQYWLVAAPDQTQFTFAGFFLNNVGATGPFAASATGGPFIITPAETLAAFDVIGNPVPEANTLLLVALGVAGCALGLHKIRR